MMLSAHFARAEFEVSDSAARNNIRNRIPDEAMPNLIGLVGLMEQVRQVLGGFPITITSGYRSPELNALVRGSKTSAHMDARAADFICPRAGSPYDVCKIIAASGIEFDQLIHEFGRWVHIATPPPGRAPRKRILTIDRLGTREGILVVRS
jgi:zinc D-Ala-D-Ala carboxypeptidase